MIPVFDYGNITDQHKEAAEEIARIIDPSDPRLSAMIRDRFKIIEPPRMAVEDSVFCNEIKKYGINANQQGYMVGPDGVHIPVVAIMAEVTKLDEVFENLTRKE